MSAAGFFRDPETLQVKYILQCSFINCSVVIINILVVANLTSLYGYWGDGTHSLKRLQTCPELRNTTEEQLVQCLQSSQTNSSCFREDAIFMVAKISPK